MIIILLILIKGRILLHNGEKVSMISKENSSVFFSYAFRIAS